MFGVVVVKVSVVIIRLVARREAVSSKSLGKRMVDNLETVKVGKFAPIDCETNHPISNTKVLIHVDSILMHLELTNGSFFVFLTMESFENLCFAQQSPKAAVFYSAWSGRVRCPR